jgi:hypothetical protein
MLQPFGSAVKKIWWAIFWAQTKSGERTGFSPRQLEIHASLLAGTIAPGLKKSPGCGLGFSVCYRMDQQQMGVPMHPQSSTVTIGPQHPHSKVSATFVFPLSADFFAVPFLALYFVMLAIFQPSFTRFLRLTTPSSPF